jgi:hypothetical protein
LGFLIKELPLLLRLAGLAQIILALASVAIPILLKWKQELHKTSPLIRNIFYTYSVYIFAINIWFGIISMAFSAELTDQSSLATSITLFTALYWLGRVAVQFIFGAAEGRPRGGWFTLGEMVLWILFIALALVYTLAALHNLKWSV